MISLLLLASLPLSGNSRAAEPPKIICESPANESAIVRLPDDSLRIFYVLRPSGDELRSIASTDNGMTWGQPKTEFTIAGKAYYAVQVLVDQTGELHAIYHIAGTGAKGYNGRHYDVWHTRTTDGRAKWEPPTRINEGYTGSLRGFVMLKSGRLIAPLAVAVPSRAQAPASGDDLGWNEVVTYFSDDRGATWKCSPDHLTVVQDPQRGKTRYGAVEPHILQLADGRVWMLIRTKNGHLYESYSDTGERWSPAVESKFISSDSPAATVRLEDGGLVMFLNQCQRWDDLRSYAIGGRDVLHGAISDDDGKTWSGFREVLQDPGGDDKGDRGTAYPMATQAKDGRIVLVSGQGDRRRFVVRIDPAWLREKTASADLNTAAATVGLNWNFPMTRSGRIRFQVKPISHAKGIAFSLTDHFSVLADAKASENAVFSSAHAGLKPDEWHDIRVDWTEAGDAKLIVDQQPPLVLRRQREPAFGVNYLRVIGDGETKLAIGKIEMAATQAAGVGAAPTAAFDDTIQFRKLRGDGAGGAVIDVGENGAFDAQWTAAPSVLRVGDRYRMWYSSYFSSSAKERRGGVGLAESKDGVDWERSSSGNPVFEVGKEGSFDAAQVMGPELLYDGNTYRMWYTGDSGRKHDPTGIVYYQIGLATSKDGVNWRRENDGNPVLTTGPGGSPDEVQVATPSVIAEQDGYRMWYAAWAPKPNHSICVARSKDGVHWIRENDGMPVSGLSPGIAFGHAVCRVGDRYVMLYMALAAKRSLFGAQSTDGIHWTMLNGGEPVIPSGEKKDFDETIAGHPFLMLEGNVLRAWYTGYQVRGADLTQWRLRIGLAEATISR